MRKKIPASYIRRVERLEKGRETQAVRSVAMLPRLVSVDEWGKIAARMQVELKANIQQDGPPRYEPADIQQLMLERSY